MPRTSSIKRLPSEIRERINTLLEQGRSLDEILGALAPLDVEVSRSALGRYKRSFDKVVEKVRRSREIADVLVRRFGDEPESKSMRANIEMMHGIVNDLLMRIGGEDDEGEGEPLVLNPQGAMFLSKALDHLAKARKSDADLIARVREEARKEAADTAAAQAETVGRERGLSAETVEAIKARILGVAQPATREGVRRDG